MPIPPPLITVASPAQDTSLGSPAQLIGPFSLGWCTTFSAHGGSLDTACKHTHPTSQFLWSIQLCGHLNKAGTMSQVVHFSSAGLKSHSLIPYR